MIRAAAVAFAGCLLAVPVAMRLAHRWGVLDRPGPLKPHDQAVPYLGGLGVMVALAAGLLASPHGMSWESARTLVPLVGALALGLVDDVTVLHVTPRLAVEVCLGGAVAWAVGADSPWSALGVVLFTVVMINAMNFLDGIDGLAAGVTLVAGAGFAAVGPASSAGLAAATAGAAAGFLVFNRPPARVFLGDAGSYALGTVLAVLACARLQEGSETFGPLAVALSVLALLGVPLAEVGSTVVRRLVQRRPLTAGDRDHLYDRLVQRGLPVPVVTLLLVGVQVVLAATVVVTGVASTAVLAVLLFVLAAASLLIALLPVSG